MPSTSPLIDAAHKLLRKRLVELDDERNRLERGLVALAGSASERTPGRPPRRDATPPTRRRRRRRRPGNRGEQAVQLISTTPGLTTREIAKNLKIKPSNAYGVLGKLVKEGRVRKEGRLYHPTA